MKPIPYDLLRSLPLPERLEIEENLLRKDFSQAELAEIQRRLIEVWSQPEHKEQGQRTDLQNATCTQSCVQVRDGKRRRRTNTTQKVARLFGESEMTLRKRLTVVEAAEEEPSTYAPLLAEVNRTGKVDLAHKKMQRLRKQKAREAAVASSGQTAGSAVVTGDFRQVGQQVAHDSVDLCQHR